jgi:ElaB/YqjD/DUF883 family membrane-anchored ribosome-binding protein
MAKLQTATSSEVQEMRKDLNSLKENAESLGKHLKNEGTEQVQQAKEALTTRLSALQTTGKKQMKKIEGQVRAKPLQSLGIAFAAGLVASLLLRR